VLSEANGQIAVSGCAVDGFVDVVELGGVVVVLLVEDGVLFPQPAIMSAVPKSAARTECLRMAFISRL
jgi:hypothetical protein